MHRVDPPTRQIDKRREVLWLGQHLGLEPTHGAGRGRTVLDCSTTDKLAHHRVAAQPVCVIDILISCKAGKDRLSQEAWQAVPSVQTGAHIGKQTRRHVREAKSVVQFPVQQ